MAVLTLRDGGRLRYRDDGAGRPLLMIHGWGIGGDSFSGQVSALPPGYRALVPDLRGHGRSSPLADGQGLMTLVEDLAELLRTLDLAGAVVIGWSMGAMVAWALMQQPEASRVAALVSIDMVPRLLNDEQWRFGLREGKSSAVYDGAAARMVADWPAFTRVFVPRVVAQGREDERRELIDRLIALSERNDPDSMARLWLSMVDTDARGWLPRIAAPCLVAFGERSQLYSPAASRWVASALADARLVAFADSGHAPHLEQPERFSEEVAAFAASATGAA